MARNERNRYVDQDFVHALAHPLRVDLLDVLNEQEASPVMLAEIVGESIWNVSYHIKVLERCGCVELTRTRARRGATEHFYRALPESSIGHQMWRQVPRSLKGNVTLASFKGFVGKLVAALEAGMVDDQDDSALSSMTLAFDQTGRLAAAGVMQDTLKRLKAIDEQSRKRAAEDGGTLSPYVSGVALFAVADSPSEHC